MPFESLEEIKNHFGFETNDLAEIRKELKLQLSENHPDKTGGAFANKKQERDYTEINEAIDFIDNSEKEVMISRKEWSLVLKKIDELNLVKNNSATTTEQDYSVQLDKYVNNSIILYQKKHSFLKISSLTITGLLTVLWAFPTIAENHPVLKNMIEPSGGIFTMTWFTALLFTAMSWIFMKHTEGRDDQIKKSYNLDSTQNTIFKIFIAWIRNLNSGTIDWDHERHLNITYFTKDDLVNFIENHYEYMHRKLRDTLSNSLQDLQKEIEEMKSNNPELNKRHRTENPLRFFFKRPGEIDIDLAQKIADTIIGKLSARHLISVSDKKTFTETYKFEHSYR